MDKLDLRKELKTLYSPTAKSISLVDIPALKFILIDGQIEPGSSPRVSPSFQMAVGALYSISYALKFMSKQRQDNPLHYSVMPLEALWWVEGSEFDYSS